MFDFLLDKSDFVFDRRDSTNNAATMKSKVTIDPEALQKEVQDILSGRYVQEQIRASICSAPGDLDLLPKINLSRKRSVFFKKIPLSYLLLLLDKNDDCFSK